MQEGLKLRVARPEGGDPLTIFFAHGHQGTPESDRFSMLARLPVRYIWPLIQRFQHATATTPARDHALRGKHDSAMFHWAREEPGRVLVAGHTHRPVFARSTPDPPARSVAELEAALDAARSGGDAAAVRRLAIELEYAKTVRRRHAKTVTVDPPCYFNTGCCSFPDGDITGIELADGEIRLVRWPANLDELRHDGEGEIDPEMRRLKGASESLDAIARAVSAGREGPGVQEHDLVP
jgi:hypothetical protein